MAGQGLHAGREGHGHWVTPSSQRPSLAPAAVWCAVENEEPPSAESAAGQQFSGPRAACFSSAGGTSGASEPNSTACLPSEEEEEEEGNPRMFGEGSSDLRPHC